MSCLACGRPSIGNTSAAMVPYSELALENLDVAIRSLSSLVTVSRTMQRTIASHGSGVTDVPVVPTISKPCWPPMPRLPVRPAVEDELEDACWLTTRICCVVWRIRVVGGAYWLPL